MIKSKPVQQNWITAYTKDDIDYILSWVGKVTDKEICKELNITEITLKEIIRLYVTEK
jgi:hypothetical protein